MQPLKYYAKGVDVLLSRAEHPQHTTSKLICTATSKRLANKIAVTLNLMESRKQKAHEIYMCKENTDGN
jgi:hypothetical protein